MALYKSVYYYYYYNYGVRYGDSVDNTVENSSVFSLIRMHWLPSARACGHKNFAPTKSSS